MPEPLPTDPLWPQVGQSLGPWLILRHHDLEGSGDMFLAKRKDGAFEREVLITLQKPTPPGEGDDPEFLVERELQGRLDHPGIAKVLGAGRTKGGLPYLVTEYLDGLDIEQCLDADRAPVPDRIRAFQQVCQAVHHAHGKYIFGLNLQASNVHLMPDGTFRIVVFGLSIWNQPEEDPSPPRGIRNPQSGPIFAGEYASPEQWAAHKPTAASDVYSLGALLYRLLTGSSPHDLQELTPAQARDRVQQGAVPRASSRIPSAVASNHAENCSSTERQLAGQLSGDLDRILAKALAVDPKERYASAQEFSEDLERHLAGQPIRARGPAPMYVLGRSLRRYRIPLALFLSVALILGWALQRSISSGERARSALIEARALESDAEQLGEKLRDLCVRFMTELGPSMQGRPGLEEARRYLLNVGAPLLDHLRGSGHEDIKLAMHICRSYGELAEADFVSRDVGNLSRTPDSARKALALSTALLGQVSEPRKREAANYYTRAVRSSVWFSELTLDTELGRTIIADIPVQLAKAGLKESELSVLSQIFLSESRRVLHASQLNYDMALEAFDLENLRAQAESTPALQPFFEADYSRFVSVRATDLIGAGNTQEALYTLPTLVYQMGEEVAAHNPPVLSLLGNETTAWINLAKVRIAEGMPPGEALIEASRHLTLIRERFTREPGAKLILAGADLGLGVCLLRMGGERVEEALLHLDRAADTQREILRLGSRWPHFKVRLAHTHRMRAQTLIALNREAAALVAVQEGLAALSGVPTESSDHSQVLVERCSLHLLELLLGNQGSSANPEQVANTLQLLRNRGVSAPYLAPIEQGLKRLQARALESEERSK
ncbi:MAG: serine/threonine-protein kinase [Planctomycetota bacterium]|nr:serine/threonine-protein kinase [Planctomycetota bacterium]